MLNVAILRPRFFFSLILLMAVAVGTGLLIGQGNYEWQGLLLVVAGIGILALFVIPRLARLEGGDFISKILIWGLLLRLVFAMGHIWVDFRVYGGTADPNHYYLTGTAIAQNIWRFQFDQLAPFLQWGTNVIEFFTGVIYSVVGPTLYGGYLIYAFLAFLGSYFFYSAFRIALPHGNKWLYAVLVFFFPSILYWSNGIGKDALIFLGIGLFAYGGAQLSQGQLRGLVPLALGFLDVMWIRPHIAAILALAFVLAFLVRGVGKNTVRPITFVLGLLAAGGIAWLLIPRVMDYLGIQELSATQMIGFLQQQQGFTYEGGSAFQVMNISNPLAFPVAIITVFFRPFPWEANNFQALIQSLEEVLLIGIVLWRLKSLGKAAASSISNAYLRFILIYIIAFAIAFTVIQNFGILARERTMMLPFFFMLLAYNPFRARTESRAQEVPVSE